MSSNTALLQRIETKTLELRKKAGSSGGNIRRELRRLSKPGPDRPDGALSGGLATLSRILGKRGVDEIHQKAKGLARRIDEAKEELESADDQINAVILAAYDSIMTDASIPEDLFDTLMDLFMKWKELQKGVEDSQLRLLKISEDLEKAEAAFDELPKPSQRTSSPPSSSFETGHFSQFDVDDLMRLRHMLYAITSLYVLKTSRQWQVRPCCARYAASIITATPTFIPGRIHNKKSVRLLQHIIKKRREAVRRAKAATRDPNAYQFVQALRLHCAVKQVLPRDILEDEKKKAQEMQAGFSNSVWSAVLTTQDMDRNQILATIKKIQKMRVFDMADGDEVLPSMQKIAGGAYAPKTFLAGMALNALHTLGIKKSAQLGESLKDEEILTILAKFAKVLENSLYTSQELTEAIALFGLPKELMSLVSPINFVLEHPDIQSKKAVLSFNQGYEEMPNLSFFLDLSPFEVLFLPDYCSCSIEVKTFNGSPVLVYGRQDEDGTVIRSAKQVDDTMGIRVTPFLTI